MSIPAAREQLEALAKDMEANRYAPCPTYWALIIRGIIKEEMHRATPISRAPRKIKPLSEDAIRLIRRQHELRPDMSQLEIASLYGTNPGRVSEVLNGKV